MRAVFFVTCLADQFFADAAADAVRLLRALGVEVAFPEGQTCCGQPAFNAGYPDEARAMARHTLRVLEGEDPVVVPGGSCAAMLRLSYPRLFAGTAEQEAAEHLARRTFELSRFLVQELGVLQLGRGLAGRRVALHCGCHALRDLGIAAEPRALLEGAGAEVVPWEAAEECCGFGGVFAVKQPEVSAAMADRKLDTLPEADWLTSGDPGCLLQLAGRAAHRAPGGSPSPPVRHLASLLWEAHREAPPETPREVPRGG